MHVRICRQKARVDGYKAGLRGRNLQMRKDLRSDCLVHENSAVLEVILKLDDVEVAIVGFQQMSLSAAPHFSNEADCVYRHRNRRKLESIAEENIS
jgi:hypothetical protein